MPHSLTDTNLRLLEGKLLSLGDTAYFDQRVISYLDSLRKVITKLLNHGGHIPNPLRDFMTREIWRGVQFLAGSAMRLQPFESVYGLKEAAREWLDKDALIITALTQEQNFFFAGISPYFKEITRQLLDVEVEEEVVQVALPDIYRHKPLFSVALYHELGHFIDARFELSANVELMVPELVLPSLSACPPEWSQDAYINARRRHLREYFADLFAASYTGRAIKRFLDDFAGHSELSPTHPKTYDRLEVIEALVQQRPHVVIQAFRTALVARRCPDLLPKYDRPVIQGFFALMRTAPLTSVRHVHGILEAGWEYLDRAADATDELWQHIEDGNAERIVNDLVAKSIRNWMIREQWVNAPLAR